MNSFRIEVCKFCDKSFETTCPGKVSYCGIACRAEAKRKHHKMYVRHYCKVCKNVVARLLKTSKTPPPELCKTCIIKPKEVKKETSYTCENCNTKFTSNTPKQFCGYTCKSQFEKVLHVVWVTQTCINCNKKERMQQWRIEATGGLCLKCTEQKDKKHNEYAALKANKKTPPCATCAYGTFDRRSDLGYVCSVNASVCKPYANAQSYKARHPRTAVTN